MAARSRKKRRTLLDGLTAFASLGWVPAPSWPRVRRAASGAAWVLGIAAIAGAWVKGVPRLEAGVADRVREDEVLIEFTSHPAWVRGDLLAMLEATARAQIAGDPFHYEDLARARRALLNTGWFEEIAQVRRDAPARIEIDASFAVPFALVRDDEGDHLIDPEGRLLPRSYGRGEKEGLIIIDGARFDRPQRPGVQWDGADVTAALRLLRLLEGRAWSAQVGRLDIGRYLNEETMTVMTDIGARIIWGRAPGEEAALEASATRKLAYLDKAHETTGRIDAGYAGIWRFYQDAFTAE